jgi:hypothetical protein
MNGKAANRTSDKAPMGKASASREVMSSRAFAFFQVSVSGATEKS